MVMTDFPSPSGRSKTAKSLAFALFRPVLFAVGAIVLALGGLVLTHRSNPDIAALPTAPPQAASPAPSPPVVSPPVVLADPEPAPPVSSAELKGFQMKPADQIAEPEPPASDRYELTLRLERGDTIEKMLADIDVPEADRKQIAEKLQGLLKKKNWLTPGTRIAQMRPTTQTRKVLKGIVGSSVLATADRTSGYGDSSSSAAAEKWIGPP